MLTNAEQHLWILREPANDRGSVPARTTFSPLRVGTLSFERCDMEMSLAKKGRSVAAIMDALTEHKPDVLVTAGWALQNEEDLKALEKQLQASDWDGLLFVEVKEFAGAANRGLAAGKGAGSHCLFAWTQKGGMQELGRQFFGTRDETRDKKVVETFEESLPNRVIEFRDRHFGALICGEINALKGRNVVDALSHEIKVWLRRLDVIVNPTHDRMQDRGTLSAKRRWLSKGGRVYISSSNWNTCRPRPQSRDSNTLHSVYRNGQAMAHSRDGNRQHEDYEYRESMI